MSAERAALSAILSWLIRYTPSCLPPLSPPQVAVSLMKVANDIRFLGSGPRCGLGELQARGRMRVPIVGPTMTALLALPALN